MFCTSAIHTYHVTGYLFKAQIFMNSLTIYVTLEYTYINLSLPSRHLKVLQTPIYNIGACNESVNMEKQLYHDEYIQKSICPRYLSALLNVIILLLQIGKFFGPGYMLYAGML